MPINFDKALGIHDDALILRTKRAEVLANNIANADTPNYKARDMDFSAVLSGQVDTMTLKPMATKQGHNTQLLEPMMGSELKYRHSAQPSVDGNTVDVQEEMARYTDNAVRFQGGFEILNSKFRGLAKAIKGE